MAETLPPPAGIDGYWIDRANHYLGYRIKHCGWNSDAVIRLFRRECRYETRWVHAEVDLPSSEHCQTLFFAS